MPTVSVIIPVYNGADLIAEAIDSVLSQTYEDYEIIVVDDGSLDNIDEVVRAYKFPVKFLKQANSGAATARNTGMRNANSDYIALLDVDDIWLPEKLEQQVRVLDADSSVGLTFCDGFRWIPPSKPQQGSLLSELYVHPPERPKLDLLFKIHMIATSSVLFRRDLLSEVGYMNDALRRAQDFEFFIRVAAKAVIHYINMPLMAYRVHSKSTSSYITTRNVMEAIQRKVKVRRIVLEKLKQMKTKLTFSMILFGKAPMFIQYGMLLWWRLRYGSSAVYTFRALIRNGFKLLGSIKK